MSTGTVTQHEKSCPICANDYSSNPALLMACLVYKTCSHQICVGCEAQLFQNALSAKMSNWDFTELGPLFCSQCRKPHHIKSDVLLNGLPKFTQPNRGFFGSIGHPVSVTYHCLMALISEVVLAVLHLGDQGFIGKGTYKTLRQQNVVQRLTRLFIETYGVPYNQAQQTADVTLSGGYGKPSVNTQVTYDPVLTWERRIWQNLSTFIGSNGS